ncbi:MAG: glycerol-3-phosphate acyltransferase PlsX [Oceanicoccus sp.]|jgi:glycerol-3-phosphate acyltransferase PlsX
MASQTRIAVDCMGGDFGPCVPVPSAVQAISRFPNIEITLVGDRQAIEFQLSQIESSAPHQFNIVHAPDVVHMSDTPAAALRHKPKSSMRMAINLVHENLVDAVVSAGNTGALLAMGCYVLKTLEGIHRPAICSLIPANDQHLYLLDLGANVDTDASHLHQFAIMGAALSSVVDGLEDPRVALLNIGREDGKGNDQVKKARKLIDADKDINFVGSIEGSDLFSGISDVVVCDGFVGNVALKVSEGTASFISSVVMEEFKRDWLSRCAALLAKPILSRIYRKLDTQRYNGASFLGLGGVVVKSHGDSTVDSFFHAIVQAKKEVECNLVETIGQRLKGKT